MDIWFKSQCDILELSSHMLLLVISKYLLSMYLLSEQMHFGTYSLQYKINLLFNIVIAKTYFPAPPSFEEKTVRLSVRKGEKASLICEASGDSPMDVFWRRNGMSISENEDAR